MIWFETINGAARIGGPAPRRSAQAGASGSGFSIPAPETGAAAEAAPMAEASLDGMLALQEAQGGAVSDREARRHSQDILAELGRLQRDLLAGDGDSASLERLATLVDNQPPAEDPRLQAVLDAVRLRALVELARRETGLSR